MVEFAVQMKTEVSELLIVASETRKQLNHMATETATVRQIALEVKLIGGEMERAREAAVVSASKLTFLDLADESFSFIID